MVSVSDNIPGRRACSASRSLIKALNRAVQILSREFSLTQDQPLIKGEDCSEVRVEWENWTAQIGCKFNGRREKRYLAAVKGCKRIFDFPCRSCDEKQATSARDVWRARVAEIPESGNRICKENCEQLKRSVRELVSGWGMRLEENRKDGVTPLRGGDTYVPDQQGCLERMSIEGGTLSTGPDECSLDDSLLRLGTAKTKGKFRVVTMQSARVKRTLRPIHNTLYDYISSFGWCVRGDVTKEDFEAVERDLNKNEDIISGDYQAATDNIFLPAVQAVVEVLAEDERLSEEERKVLLGSFENIRWISKSGKEWSINRGSMMGNLVSFCVLCLLNKACHDIASINVYGLKKGRCRIGRFNGDDCLFAGNRQLYLEWRRVTSLYGLVVNEEKTGVSRRWAELNSRTFDLRQRSFVSKPVFSWLLPSRNKPGEILTSILTGIRDLKTSLQRWIVHVVMRHEICLRGFALSNIPSGWVRNLVKKKWFRKCAIDGPATTIAPIDGARLELKFSFTLEKGKTSEQDVVLPVRDRSFPTVVGVPPRSEYYQIVDELCAIATREHTEYWTGKHVRPLELRLDRAAFARRSKDNLLRSLPTPKLLGIVTRWSFIWPKYVYECIRDNFPRMLIEDQELFSSSLVYHPQLSLSHTYRIKRESKFHPPPTSLLRGTTVLTPFLRDCRIKGRSSNLGAVDSGQFSSFTQSW